MAGSVASSVAGSVASSVYGSVASSVYGSVASSVNPSGTTVGTDFCTPSQSEDWQTFEDLLSISTSAASVAAGARTSLAKIAS